MKMVHPEIEAAAEVLSVQAFYQIWAPRGWELLDGAAEFANEHLGRFVRDTKDLTVDELRALIATKDATQYPDATATGASMLATYDELFAGGPPRPTPATESATGVPIKLYDPSEHPVHTGADGVDKGVLAYLDAADDDERQRVLELEEAGQARTTILNWSPPVAGSEDAADGAAGQEN